MSGCSVRCNERQRPLRWEGNGNLVEGLLLGPILEQCQLGGVCLPLRIGADKRSALIKRREISVPDRPDEHRPIRGKEFGHKADAHPSGVVASDLVRFQGHQGPRSGSSVASTQL